MNEKQKLKFAKCSECGSTDLECSFGEFIVGPKDSKVYSECKRVYTCKNVGINGDRNERKTKKQEEQVTTKKNEVARKT